MSDRDELIRNRAYAIWQAGGSPHGHDTEHWAQATAEVDVDVASISEAAAPPATPAATTPIPARRPAKRTPTTSTPKPRRRQAD